MFFITLKNILRTIIVAQILLFVSNCYSEEKSNLIKQIEKCERIKFIDIEVSQNKFQYRPYDPPLNLLTSEIKNLPVKYDTPLRTFANQYSQLYQKERPAKERLKEYLDPRFPKSENMFPSVVPVTNWYSIEIIAKKLNKKVSEDNFDDIILECLIKIAYRIECIGELRQDNYAAIIVNYLPPNTTKEQRIKEIQKPYDALEEFLTKHPEPGNDSKPEPDPEYKKQLQEYNDKLFDYMDIISRQINIISMYKKDNRWHFLLLEEYKTRENYWSLHSSTLASIIMKEGQLYQILTPKEPIPPKKIWRHWETFRKDYKVEGKFVHFDGEFVTIMKRDGTKEKIKYKKLCSEDQFYVDKEVEEQKKRYEKELKELPEQLAKEPFHEWITKIYDYKVTGEFISYDGKFVTIKKPTEKLNKSNIVDCQSMTKITSKKNYYYKNENKKKKINNYNRPRAFTKIIFIIIQLNFCTDIRLKMRLSKSNKISLK
jgi:hypothetical protein